MNQFAYSMVNGLLGYPLLESIDYRPVLMEEASAAAEPGDSRPASKRVQSTGTQLGHQSQP